MLRPYMACHKVAALGPAYVLCDSRSHKPRYWVDEARYWVLSEDRPTYDTINVHVHQYYPWLIQLRFEYGSR